MKTIGQPSVEAQMLAKELCKLGFSQIKTYAELEALIPGTRLQGRHRGILNSARKIAQGEGIVTACIKNVGIKRLEDAEIIEIPTGAMAKVRRVTRRAAQKTVKANYDALTSEQKTKFNVGLSVLGAITMFTKPKAQTTIEKRVNEVSGKLQFEDTIKLFAK